jgi:hypothetical protein
VRLWVRVGDGAAGSGLLLGRLPMLRLRLTLLLMPTLMLTLTLLRLRLCPAPHLRRQTCGRPHTLVERRCFAPRHSAAHTLCW